MNLDFLIRSIGELWDKVAGLRRDVNHLLRLELTAADHVDWSGTVVTGWTTPPTVKQIEVMRSRTEKMITVIFRIEGTSNTTTAAFDLPVAQVAGGAIYGMFLASDNGGAFVPGLWTIPSGGGTVSFFKDLTAGAWTPGGTKIIRGQFSYFFA